MALLEIHTVPGSLRHVNLTGGATADSGEFLPRLPFWAVTEALRHLPREERDFVVRNKLLPVVFIPGFTLYASFGESARRLARQKGLKLVAQGGPADFISAARQVFGRRFLHEATFGLASRQPVFSASRRFSIWQLAVTLAAVAAIGAACVVLPINALWAAASLWGGLFFLSVIALRILSLMPRGPFVEPEAAALDDEQLPDYSILVPLFRETAVLDQLLSALDHLRYPVLCSKRTKR